MVLPLLPLHMPPLLPRTCCHCCPCCHIHHQVLREGVWHTVQPLPGAFTVNVGDMAQVFSNDAFYASNHRVLRSVGAERYSRAYFFNPSAQASIAPRTDLAIAGACNFGAILIKGGGPVDAAVMLGLMRRTRRDGQWVVVVVFA